MLKQACSDRNSKLHVESDWSITTAHRPRELLDEIVGVLPTGACSADITLDGEAAADSDSDADGFRIGNVTSAAEASTIYSQCKHRRQFAIKITTWFVGIYIYRFFPQMAHCTYPRRDGQAEWAIVAWINTGMVYPPLVLLSTDRERLNVHPTHNRSCRG